MGGYPLDQLGRIWRADAPTSPDRGERQKTARLLGILDKRQIRDVVAYLSGLKKRKRK
jgi:hypothetical protein